MAPVTITVWDFNTNTFLTHLPYADAQYAVRLNDAGECTITIDLADTATHGPVTVIQSLNGAPFKVLFSQGPIILHAAFIYRVEMSSDTFAVKLTGAALTSALTLVTNEVAGIGVGAPLVTDPVTVIENILDGAQTTLPLYITHRRQVQGLPAAATWTYSKDATAGQILADATAAVTPGTGGVDWTIENSLVGGRPSHTMVIWTPRAGTDYHTSGWSVDLTRAAAWQWNTDAQRMTTKVVAVGSGAGSNAAIRSVATTTKATGGLGQLPVFTGVYQFSQVNDQGRLDAIAHGLISLFGGPVAAPTITLPIDYPTLPLGAAAIGDDVRLTAPVCPWFPLGLNQWWRAVAYSVNIPAQGVATVQWTFNTPPAY